MRFNGYFGIAASTVLIGLLAGGCTPPPPAPAADGSDRMVSGFLQKTDMTRFQESRVRTLAIVTGYEEGRSFSNRQSQEIDFKNNVISASAATGTGIWNADVPAVGEASISGKTTFEDRKSIEGILRLLLHRVHGPLNLVGGSERPLCATNVRLLDEPLVRIAVAGEARFAIAYYFDPATGLLKYITSGADRPGGEGTITLYTWQKLPGGGFFPKTIKVMRIGQHALIGEQPVLEAVYTNVRVSH